MGSLRSLHREQEKLCFGSNSLLSQGHRQECRICRIRYECSAEYKKRREEHKAKWDAENPR
jgi:hypothetical protein